MLFAPQDLLNTIDDLVAVRMKLDRWCVDLTTSTQGRLSMEAALLVGAEGNVFRALVALKEAYRRWAELAQADQLNQHRLLVEASDLLVAHDSDATAPSAASRSSRVS